MVAKEAAVRRAAMNYLPMLSHQQLLYLLTMSFISRWVCILHACFIIDMFLSWVNIDWNYNWYVPKLSKYWVKLSHFHSFSDLHYKVLYIRNFHYCPLSNVMNGYQPTPIPDELLKLFFFFLNLGFGCVLGPECLSNDFWLGRLRRKLWLI